MINQSKIQIGIISLIVFGCVGCVIHEKPRLQPVLGRLSLGQSINEVNNILPQKYRTSLQPELQNWGKSKPVFHESVNDLPSSDTVKFSQMYLVWTYWHGGEDPLEILVLYFDENQKLINAEYTLDE
jgi:hypothetical protein